MMHSLAELGLASWVEEVRVVLDEVSPERGMNLARAAAGHLADDPVIAFVGEYTAGKSSLIKRLLLESGATVPPELFVDASPATDRAYEARARGWRLRDTPGLDSELAGDSVTGGSAIQFADVVALNILATLFSEGSEVGQLIASVGKQLAGANALVVILTQADRAAGTSGGERYANWCQAKSDELKQLLERNGLTEVCVFAVSADARGAIGNRDVTADAYERSRAWDGIAGLRQALLERPCAPELRRAAIVRAATREIHRACSELIASVRRTENAIAERTAQMTALDAAVDQLRQLDRESRESLRHALIAAATSGPTASAMARVLVAAERWTAERAERLERHATEWDIDIDVWRYDPRPLMDLPFVPDIESEDTPELDLDEAEEALKAKLKPLAGDPDRAAELGADLKRWREAKRRQKTREYYGEHGGFGSLREARQAEQELSALRRRQMALQVATTALDFWREERDLHRQARARDAADRAARERAEAHAAITSRVLYDGLDEVPGWRRELNRVVEALEERRESASSAAREGRLEVERIEELGQRLQALVGAV